MKLKHKSFALELKAEGDDRTVEGWASTFGNKDAGSDVIVAGAFAESLATRKPKMLWQHQDSELIGVWDAATETAQGLYVKGRFADTIRGNEAYTLAKMGALDSMSIGYSTKDHAYDPASNIRTLKKLDLWEVSLVTFPMNERATITAVKAAAEDIDIAYDLLDQACGMCQAYAAGGMEPTPEAFATVLQMMQQAQTFLGDPATGPGEGESEGVGEAKLSPKQIERILREAGMSRGDARGVLAKGYHAIALPREADGLDAKTLTNLLNQFKL